MPALATTVCFRQNKIIAVLELCIVVGKQERVLYSRKEKARLVLQGLYYSEMSGVD